MKVALCLSSLPLSGIGTSIGIIYDGLTAAGHNVDVLITSHEKGDDFERARKSGLKIMAISLGERYLKHRLIKTINTLNQYQVVINNFSLETQLSLPFLGDEIVKLSVMRALGDKALSLVSMNSRYLDSVIAVSAESVEVLENNPNVHCPVQLIPNCTLAVSNEHRKANSPIKICYVGRLSTKDKNILILPGIVSSLMDAGLDFEFVVAGDGPDKNKFVDECKKFGIGKKVEMVGIVSREVAVKILSEAHFTIIPSFYEGLSNVMLEAMALGCVPVVSDISNFKWVLGECAQKLQVPVTSTGAYAKKIIELCADEVLYAAIQSNLLKRQKDYFTPENTISSYLELLEEYFPSKNDVASIKTLSIYKLPFPYNIQCTAFWRPLQMLKIYFNRFCSVS